MIADYCFMLKRDCKTARSARISRKEVLIERKSRQIKNVWCYGGFLNLFLFKRSNKLFKSFVKLFNKFLSLILTYS